MSDHPPTPAPAPGRGTPLTDRLDQMAAPAATWALYRLANAADHGEALTLAQAMDQADRAARRPRPLPAVAPHAYVKPGLAARECVACGVDHGGDAA